MGKSQHLCYVMTCIKTGFHSFFDFVSNDEVNMAQLWVAQLQNSASISNGQGENDR